MKSGPVHVRAVYHSHMNAVKKTFIYHESQKFGSNCTGKTREVELPGVVLFRDDSPLGDNYTLCHLRLNEIQGRRNRV